MSWQADPARYDAERPGAMRYRRVGRSGLKLPLLTLGLWHNFGDDVPLERQRALITTAFDRGVTHFDLANNYGPPFGAAESNFGRVLSGDLAAHRDEILVTTKAGWDMWPGPYGFGGSRKYLIASLDQSLARMGLDYVDIFYHHRPDPETPLEETMAALDHIVRTGRALYVGVSSYSADETRRAHAILESLGTPLTIHQPSYSLLNRWIETDGLLDAAGELGIGVIGFTALAQGLLTGKYLDGVPADSRAARGGERKALDPRISDAAADRIRGLAAIAERRGQTLAQLALAWALRDERVTSLTIGASRLEQLEENLGALEHLAFSPDELAEIDELAKDEPGVDLWAAARDSRS
ncbi:L-glyceraldehyde 3-phosphate reductase [Agrococcus sp. HG114]|uniref:L-glyceraldehyde 3-phosphate reductase n=1 Tax=Agrococcus sp. HG114 TaxID=2969757 RepID=UPI00215A3B60|nr:L-glyceraldehyde 3-phosphate reductase [Agrococcus sp. HG114]MCR8671959.1 L-glyceraldehyde 3-phosphate reductase [Agrococcus sp. HG114]